MKQTISFLLMFLTFALSSCSGSLRVLESPDISPTCTQVPVATTTQVTGIREIADLVIKALSAKDMATLAQWIHPEREVRFSPYAFIREEYRVMRRDELLELVGSGEVFNWGAYDGSGEPITLTFDAYFQEFVYSADFANAEVISFDKRMGQGNSLNNISEFFPGSSFVEYHFSGFDAQYEGMDWQSLRLVFVQEDGIWWLVAIVHDEWTV